MTQGPGRFEYYLIKLDDLLLQASQSENPAEFLYKNNARTILFMLEGLSKLYAGLHNNKKFTKIADQFKKAEDALGRVDYYDCFAKEFLADPEMPSTVRMFLEEKKEESLSLLNNILLKKKWINHHPLRTKKIRARLKKADWQNPEKEIEMISRFFERSIADIKKFYAETTGTFTDIEEQVHSLRRKLRWLSIYPQALQGAVQLSDKTEEDEAIAKYLVPEIVNSPFNKMPPAGNNKSVLLLEKKYFLALSWMIAELGKLKDNGLRILATAEAVHATQFVTDEIALQRAFQLNKLNDDGLKNIMSKAGELCSLYFEEENLDKLLAGAEKTV